MIQLTDVFEGLCCHFTLIGLVQIVELAPSMGHSADFGKEARTRPLPGSHTTWQVSLQPDIRVGCWVLNGNPFQTHGKNSSSFQSVHPDWYFNQQAVTPGDAEDEAWKRSGGALGSAKGLGIGLIQRVDF